MAALARIVSLRADYNPKWVGRDDNGSRVLLTDWRFATGVVFHFH